MKGIFVDCFVLLLGFVPEITWKFFELFYAQGPFDQIDAGFGFFLGLSTDPMGVPLPQSPEIF